MLQIGTFSILEYLEVILLGYFVGSFPTGLVVGRLFKGIDVREFGSGKTGATNVLRSAGKRAAVITLLADVGKGALPVVVSWVLFHSFHMQVIAGLAVMAGHVWPLWAKFRGGRAVGTYVGALGAMYWPIALVSGVLFGLGIAFVSRYVSLGSIFVVFSSFLIMFIVVVLGMQPLEYLAYTGLGGALILYLHRDNIQRLSSGTERRLGEKGEKRPFTSSHVNNMKER